MKRVLITGATGFIGQHCLPLLTELGYDVHGVTAKPIPDQAHGVQWHRADLLDLEACTALIREVQPTHLLHLAWFVEPGAYWSSLENLRWVQASLQMLRAFASYRGQRVVIAGTCAEYDWTYGYCSEAVTPLVPTTLYGTCKHSLRLIAEASSAQLRLSTAWGRIFFLYGPGERPQRLIASTIRALLSEEPARCTHGQQIRDLLFVCDVAAAFVALLDSEVKGAVNIASGVPVTLKSVVNRIADKLNRHELIQFGALATPADEPGLLVADVNRLVGEVGWRARYTLDEGLDETIEWWRARTTVAKRK